MRRIYSKYRLIFIFVSPLQVTSLSTSIISLKKNNKKHKNLYTLQCFVFIFNFFFISREYVLQYVITLTYPIIWNDLGWPLFFGRLEKSTSKKKKHMFCFALGSFLVLFCFLLSCNRYSICFLMFSYNVIIKL